MRPVRNIVPPLGGLDLSPIFVFLILSVLRQVVDHLGAAVGMPV
jgi:YggT family protein